MKLTIKPKDGKFPVRSESSAIPLNYDFYLNGESLEDNVDLRITELDLKMRAGKNPELVIHADPESIDIEDFIADLKKDNPDK